MATGHVYQGKGATSRFAPPWWSVTCGLNKRPTHFPVANNDPNCPILPAHSANPPRGQGPPRPPSSILHPPSSILHPPSSILHPPSSILQPPSSILHPPSSILHPPSSILHPSLGFSSPTLTRWPLHWLLQVDYPTREWFLPPWVPSSRASGGYDCFMTKRRVIRKIPIMTEIRLTNPPTTLLLGDSRTGNHPRLTPGCPCPLTREAEPATSPGRPLLFGPHPRRRGSIPMPADSHPRLRFRASFKFPFPYPLRLRLV
jgi:hypothetical protein